MQRLRTTPDVHVEPAEQAVDVRAGLSEAMDARIAVFAHDDYARRATSPAGTEMLAGMLHALLVDAQSDAQAERLFALLADVRARGFDSDILRALTGQCAFALVVEECE